MGKFIKLGLQEPMGMELILMLISIPLPFIAIIVLEFEVLPPRAELGGTPPKPKTT